MFTLELLIQSLILLLAFKSTIFYLKEVNIQNTDDNECFDMLFGQLLKS